MMPWFLSPCFLYSTISWCASPEICPYISCDDNICIALLSMKSHEYSCWLLCNIHYCELSIPKWMFRLPHLSWAFWMMLFPLGCFLCVYYVTYQNPTIFVILTCINVSYISSLHFTSLEGRSCPCSFFYSDLNIMELGIYWQSLRETIQRLL